MTPPRRVGLVTCASLVVANMVGTGIFTSLGFQLAEITSPPVILLLWALGGVLALCGALCYAELSAALPRSGGEYHFLGRIYHPSLGFMGGLVSLVVGFAAPVALSAMAFGSYLQGLFPAISPQAASVAVVVIVTLFHLGDLRLSSIFQIVFTFLKIGLIVFLCLTLLSSPSSDFISVESWGKHIFSAPFAVSLMFTLYAYSGWNAATYILDEVRTPARVIPRALIIGTLLVTVLYLVLNYAFLQAAPTEKMVGQLNVAQVAAQAVLGSEGGRLVAAVIALGLISAISAMIWAGPRVALVIGEDYPKAFGWLQKRNRCGIPAVAVISQSTLTLGLLLTSSFEQVLIYAQFALLACGFLTVFGVIVLRFTQPNLPRPFRVPFYPVTPILFLGISAFTMAYSAAERPIEALFGGLTLLAGLIVYQVVGARKHP